MRNVTKSPWIVLIPALIALGLVMFACSVVSVSNDLATTNAQTVKMIPLWKRAANDWCKRQPQECAPYKTHIKVVELTPERRAQLFSVNDAVNHEFKYLTDKDHYDEPEYWNYPADGYADCEDYALEKRRRLIAMGWPREALLLAVVVPPGWPYFTQEMHMVLLARTNEGTLVVDSALNEASTFQPIMSLMKSDYDVFSVQSQDDPKKWIDLVNWVHVEILLNILHNE